MVKVVIFDFDLTLFDSSSIKNLMDKRQWTLVYKNISSCSFYPYAIDMIASLQRKNILTAIVSNAPSSYVKRVLSLNNIHMDIVICYHDVIKHKPSPDGINKVLDYFSLTNHEAIYIGDNNIDYQTAKNADVTFYGVSWGTFSNKTNIIDYKNFSKL